MHTTDSLVRRENRPRGAGLLSASIAGLSLLCASLFAWGAERADDTAVVDCLFPAQVRRLGAFSTTLLPRRHAKVAVAQCREAGGEYVEPLAASAAASPAAAMPAPASPITPVVTASADPLVDLKIWLPMAAEGVIEAQVTAGEIYERMGQAGLAAYWYGKASSQHSSRALVNLAAMHEQGRGMARDPQQAQRLILEAAGVAGLAGAGTNRPRIQLIDPSSVIRIPAASGANGVIAVDAPEGPLMITGRAESTVGIDSVSINGEARPHDSNGMFSVPLALGNEPVHLKISAVDKAGVSGATEFTLRRSAVQAAPPAPLPAAAAAQFEDSLSGRRHAIVISNQHYQHWESLDTPLADGRAVADILRTRFGFDVTLVADATRRDMLAALSQLRARAGPDDQVVVYYAGHGQMDPVTTRGYWIPVDADTRELSNWVSVIDVTDQLSAMQARHVLVIADSCYSGTLAGSLIARIDAALSAEQRQQHLTQLTKRRSRVALTSGGLEPVIDAGGGAHSLFAHSLLDVLAQVREPIGAQELFSTVAARFAVLGKPLKVSQQPRYAPIAFAGHEAGDFLLAPRQ